MKLYDRREFHSMIRTMLLPPLKQAVTTIHQRTDGPHKAERDSMVDAIMQRFVSALNGLSPANMVDAKFAPGALDAMKASLVELEQVTLCLEKPKNKSIIRLIDSRAKKYGTEVDRLLEQGSRNSLSR